MEHQCNLYNVVFRNESSKRTHNLFLTAHNPQIARENASRLIDNKGWGPDLKFIETNLIPVDGGVFVNENEYEILTPEGRTAAAASTRS